jgi:HEAT repeat protein
VGRIAADALVQRILTPLLDHSDAIVREGAIYGLRGHENEEIHARLTRLATSDASWEVRQVAADALADS